MTAEEMFKELGFECKIIETNHPSGEPCHKEIKYFINSGTIKDLYFGYDITFILDKKNNNISRHYGHSFEIDGGYIDMPLLQAINKQIEELGWK